LVESYVTSNLKEILNCRVSPYMHFELVITLFIDYIFCYVGSLLPRHLEIFNNNSFFKGLPIPEPEVMVSSNNTAVQ